MKAILLFFLFFPGILSFGQTGIDRDEVIMIGGIRQCITIQSKDRSLPLLLFLHGGPGGSVMRYANKFTDKLREHFIVVQWDQRQTGRTLEFNTSPLPLTLAAFQSDTHELIDTLLRRFRRERLYLAGHSWGTALGFDIARKYPECLYAFIAIGPMVNQLESERVVLAMMKEKALKTHNQTESEELARVKIPFENGEQLYYHRKWLLDLGGSRKKLSENYVLDWSSTWLQVFNEASKENLTESLLTVHCPVYFFAGREDYQTNSGITEAYYKQVAAPRKGLFWFECAHSIPSSQPRRMQQLIIETVLPETLTPNP